MSIRVKSDHWIELATRIVIVVFLVGYLILSMLLPAYPTGESGSFSLSLVSLMESGDFMISEEEYQIAIQTFPEHQTYLDWYYNDFLPRDAQGNAYPWYFGIYSMLCIPVFLLLKLLGLNVIYSFAITNALLLAGALYFVYRQCHLPLISRFLLLMLLGFSPIIRYIQWQSYEVATCSFVMVSMTYWFTGRRKLAALFLAFGATMNPTAMAFGIFMILEFFFDKLRDSGWNVSAFFKSCLSGWKEIGIYALCFVPCLIPIGITYVHFGTFNMAAMTGVTDYAGIFPRFVAYFLDLNFGMLPYVPFLLIFLIIIAACAIRNKTWKYIFAILGILGTVAAFSITGHINCGMTGIARYNAWLLPMLIFTVIYAADNGVLRQIPKKCTNSVVVVSVCWCLFTVTIVAYSPTKGTYLNWEPFAVMAMEYTPQLYNPLPSTFNSRTSHVDGGYEISEPVIYTGLDGYVRKVLVPTELGKESLTDLVVGDDDRAVFDAECEKIDQTKEFCYLNFPSGTKIQKAAPYQYGSEVLFTSENDGTRYFDHGISIVETNFAWSNGLESRIVLNIGAVTEDIPVQFDFQSVYGGSQTLIVTSHGQELFHETITQEDPHASFMIPQELVENGVIDLELNYPNAVDLATLNNGTDNRVIALGWSRMVFGENS